ncbi:tRNA(Met) cytidine acetyltransferase [Photobacterium damselae subsp. piscicida]|uniref:tRNA(Met) cytidine acetyltransferase TmcA n=1 Tax=Photobacterium damselae TaxID=38293 RepID=UPI0002D55018|nr:GNAT family N-acetyltransferase [Photobacterium damselae]OLQ79018.1 hypothetical protein BEI67_18835 [Photobacterium damselae subsp. piscicida]TFZ54429.1 tRNA(Met) cytidine acetyltransferase [Photobacterium damselae subsp. piscicida]TJZ85046.1 tRNA(Met) cytidine acetyltransferase [Photobacterium damselae subsp. piscicida]
MHIQFSHYLTQLIPFLQQTNSRRLVVIQGSYEWAQPYLKLCTSYYQEPLWVGELSSNLYQGRHISYKKAKTVLGQETDCVIFDGNSDLSYEAIGAVVGTIKGGGLAILFLPEEWEEANLAYQRLLNYIDINTVLFLSESRALFPKLPEIDDSIVHTASSVLEYGAITLDQQKGIEAIIKVMTGHRKRPLVLTADRGRGKSAALGLAAAQLLSQRKIKIVVTAPSLKAAQNIFYHAADRLGLECHLGRELSWQQSMLVYVAPDELLQQHVDCDLLFVDEAAAIPTSILERILNRYSRIVFSSTIHGYEGTGRGFAIKFKQILANKMPQFRSILLHQPVRWAENDPLEKWCFDALMLNAEMADVTQLPSHYSEIIYSLVSIDVLAKDEERFRQFVGLLINAHYQTSPNDIQLLLTHPDVLCFIASYQGRIIGCCIVLKEGGFDSALAEEVRLGQRRIKGHLLPQSIAAHIGLDAALTQGCGRIQRIAIHPNCQQQGLGLKLLETVTSQAKTLDLDYLGTSFGASSDLTKFWIKANYQFIRLGLTKDASSGVHSALAVYPLTTKSETWLESAQTLFAANLMYQRVEVFSQLEPSLLLLLWRSLKQENQASFLSLDLMNMQLSAFLRGGMGYDLVVASLEQLMMWYLSQPSFLSEHDESFFCRKVFQKRSWSELVIDYELVGQKQAEQKLRAIVQEIFLKWSTEHANIS